MHTCIHTYVFANSDSGITAALRKKSGSPTEANNSAAGCTPPPRTSPKGCSRWCCRS